MENCSLYGNYAICVEGAIDKTKECLLEQIFDTIRELAKKDEFWIVKKVSDSNLSCQIAADPDKTYTVAWKAESPQMCKELDYKERMKQEYWQLKGRYSELHRMCVCYEAGTLDFTPDCSLELLKEQKAAMGNYLCCLEIRAEIEGIKLL